MAVKSKHAEEKVKKTKKKAVSNTASKKSSSKTSTIDVIVEKKPNPKDKQNIKQEPKKNKKQSNDKNGKNKKSKNKNQVKNPNKIQKRKKRPSKILKFLGIICLIVAAVIFLFSTPLFNVTEIIVQGNHVVSSDEIISLSQIQLNENMFKNLKSVIKENVKGNAYIEDVETKRILPNKMLITVQERQVNFMVRLLNNYAYINNQGYILEITEQTKEVPILEGIKTSEEDIIVGKRLNNEDLDRLEDVIKIVSSCEENEISRYITSINVSNQNEYIMILAEKGKTVHLGNSSNLDTKMLYVKAMLQAEEGNEGDIFVNGDLNNGFQPYFRIKV